MKKVSILTPCYNSASYIHRLLDSVLTQTYPNIEMFVINDGSTDNSEKVIKSYIPKFYDRGLTLKYMKQSNQGQAAAINNGLKFISGKYLIWPDSDDFFSDSKSIEIMVETFENNSDVSIVRCFSSVLDEKTLKIIDQFGEKENNKRKGRNLFEDCLLTKNNFWFGAGNYMIRTDILDYYYPDREIYPSNTNGGQNWQLLLPALYNKKCVTIEKTLHNILARNDSHSRIASNNLDSILSKYTEHEKILLKTIEFIRNMNESELLTYKEKIKIKYAIIRIMTFSSFGQKKQAKIEYDKIKDKLNFKNRILILLSFRSYLKKIKYFIKDFT